MFDVMRIAADKGLVQAKRSSVAAGYSDTAFTKPPSARLGMPIYSVTCVPNTGNHEHVCAAIRHGPYLVLAIFRYWCSHGALISPPVESRANSSSLVYDAQAHLSVCSGLCCKPVWQLFLQTHNQWLPIARVCMDTENN